MVSQCPILAWEQFSYDQTISCCNVGNHKYDLAKSAVCLLFTQTKKTIYEPSVAFISTKRRVLLFITHDATRKKPRGIHRFITATLIVSCLFFFSHEYVVQGVTSQALDVGNKWPLSCYHLQTSPPLVYVVWVFYNNTTTIYRPSGASIY